MTGRIYAHTQKIWLLSLVARYGSFSAAALEAGISQSALSQSIAELEKFLGKTLLIRNPGSVVPTSDGASLLLRLKPLLVELGHIEMENETLPHINGTKLHLGAYESIAINFLPMLLPQLKRKYPGLRIEVRTARSHILSSMVDRGELDLALIVEHQMRFRIESHNFADDMLGVYVSAHHPISNSGWDALEEYGLGTLAPVSDGHPRYFQLFLKSLNTSVTTVTRSDSFEVIGNLARNGIFAAVLPNRVANRHNSDFMRISPANRQIDLGQHKLNLIVRKNLDERIKELMLNELKAALQPS